MINLLLVIFITLIIGCLTLFYFRKKNVKSSLIYTYHGWSFGYYIRWIFWVFAVWRHQRQRKPRLNNYRKLTKDFRYSGFVPTPEEVKLESAVQLTTNRHEDAVVMWGTDSSGKSLYAKVVRLAGNRTAVFLVIREGDGTLYTIPNQPDGIICHTDGQTWRGAGLSLECVQSMRTWRLKFNGYLRKGTRLSYTTDITNQDDDDVIEARIDLIWRALRAPVDLFRDSDPRLLASALAGEPDADLRYFTSLDRDAYDQHGTLSGLVLLDIEKQALVLGEVEEINGPNYWYLRGGRQRRWGMSEAATKVHRSVEFLNFFDNGDCLYHYTFSYPNSLSHCSFGYLQTASGHYKPLSHTTFNLAEVGEDGTIPTHVFFKCSGKFQSGETCVSLNKGAVVHYSGDPWTLKHEVAFTDVFFGSKRGYGMGVFTSSYSDLCPVPEQYSGSLLEEFPVEQSSDITDSPPLVSLITNRLSCDVGLTGGKGSSLAFLSSLDHLHCPEKILVPKGVVVTTKSWRLQLLSCPQLSSALDALHRVVGSGQDTQIKDACVKATDLFISEKVCQEIESNLRQTLGELFDENISMKRFAVRSSGSDEDSGEASAAGQNLTILGCQGIDQILTAIPKCWASLVTYTSVQYRRQRGLNPIGEMAVVIQEMVDPDIAGVIFTRHPITGSPSSVIITANYGLGETVVSGSSEPDTITVHCSWRGKLSIKSTDVGAKAQKQVICDEGIKNISVHVADRSKCCVNEDLALRLARVALHVEKACRSPRDIEFAVKNEHIYLLQSRPITNLDSWSELEILTELDTAVMTETELFTRANTGEVFPLPSTPLNVSVVGKALDLAIQKTMSYVVYLREYNFDPANHRGVVFSYLHACLNILECMLILVGDKLTIQNIITDLCVFGHPVTTEAHIKKAVERHGMTSVLDTVAVLCLQFFRAVTNNRVIANAKDKFQQYKINTSRVFSASDVYKEISTRLPDLLTMCNIHTDMSTSSSSSQNIAFFMLTEGTEDVTPVNIADMAQMLAASCEGQESAGVPGALKELAEAISLDSEVKEFLSMSTDEGSVWLESHPGEVGDKYLTFLSNHGHRCIQELEISSKSWGMDGTSLVKTLQTIAANPICLNNNTNTRTDVKEIIANLSTPLKSGTKRVLQFFLPLCRVSVQRREAAKSYTAKVIDAFRKAYRTLGELMVLEGRLPSVELLYFLQHHEIGRLLENRSPLLVSKAFKRKRLRTKMMKLSLPEISEGRYNPFEKEPTEAETTDGTDQKNVVKGTAVCIGKASGTARVVCALDEAANIKRGDILITYSTDVGWSPYFPLLGGVVTEIGGLISHGAVVAREYGLPCVVGAVNATKIFKSGDLIELNGSTGTITKLN